MAKRELEVLVKHFREQQMAMFHISGLMNVLAEQSENVADALERLIGGVPPEPKPDPKPEPKPKPSSFRAFHIMKHNNQPDLRPLGIEPLKIWYEGAFFDSGHSDRDADVDMDKVRATARKSPGVSCIDIERWADKDTWEVSERNVKRYVEVMKAYREALPDGHTFGLYSVVPVRNYWDVARGTMSKLRRWNDRVTPIAEHADMIFPSLYTFSSVFENSTTRLADWERYAVGNIEEAKRIAPGKPVYPFLWPWYHPKADKPIGGVFWREQLEVCKKHADGVVIWDDLKKNRMNFGNLPLWWGETKRFLEGL